MQNKSPNRLIHATSPYLLQHAHNPVDWFEWGKEALEKSKKEDKPILISIGYASCHWCHVMERESFEIDDIAQVMNEYFVCIKVDREERPDIDQIYMEAVQALGINGGWPLNVFLTPDQKPFYGGTYFTPQVWVQVLQNINKAYLGNRKKLEETAEDLHAHLLRSDIARFKQPNKDARWAEGLQALYAKLSSHFDPMWGGLDKAPKFIMPSIWQLLLRFHHLTGDQSAVEHLAHTLNKIMEGGIYDQVGGGFARYAVDVQWFAPHFEKMLYDNAQLLSLYADAFALTKDRAYKTIVEETFGWLSREMTDSNGGFYAALDADSEGVEGQYYVWEKSELETLLGADEPLISAYYGVTPTGNWEHGKNILKRTGTDTRFLEQHDLTAPEWSVILAKAKQQLLEHRNQRPRPALDDKIVTAWNALTVTGLVDAYRAVGDPEMLASAQKNMRFLEAQVFSGPAISRSFKGQRSRTSGFLDDYAFVIQALIKLYQVTFDEHWIEQANRFIDYTLDHFYDPTDGFFFYTSSLAEELIARKKEIFDNVIPSSNAIMAQNLFLAGSLQDREDWKKIAVDMTTSLSQLIQSEPNYMSQWAIVLTEIHNGLDEVVLVGSGIQKMREALQKDFLPFVMFQGNAVGGSLPLSVGKTAIGGKDTIYVCYQRTCKLPVHTVADAKKQLR